jgi:monoamine oxidase
VKRRQALKTLGWGVSAGLVLPPFFQGCADKGTGPEIRYDGVVGIVGAGAAGLLAAEVLSSKGIKVRIFEASDRVGGRIQSIKINDDYPVVSDFPLELGADQVIGTESRWGDLLRLMKVPLIPVATSSENSFVVDDAVQTASSLQADADFISLLSFYENTLRGYTGGGNALTAANAAVRMAGVANAWLGNNFGTSADRIGASTLGAALAARTHDSARYTLSSNTMHDVLVSRFYKVATKVELNRKITSINYGGDLITLQDSNGATEQVNFLIVAVPISVLKNNTITFSPALPSAKTAALTRLQMDNSIRIILEFKKNFWGDEVGFLYGGSRCPSYFSAGVGRSDFNKTMVLTINGEAADNLTALTDEQKVLQVLEELDALYDGEATDSIRRDTTSNTMLYVVKDWSQHPNIGGGYVYPLVGSTTGDFETLAAPVSDKLFFAGDGMDVSGDFGTISGALNSAEKAALEIINVILAV